MAKSAKLLEADALASFPGWSGAHTEALADVRRASDKLLGKEEDDGKREQEEAFTEKLALKRRQVEDSIVKNMLKQLAYFYMPTVKPTSTLVKLRYATSSTPLGKRVDFLTNFTFHYGLGCGLQSEDADTFCTQMTSSKVVGFGGVADLAKRAEKVVSKTPHQL